LEAWIEWLFSMKLMITRIMSPGHQNSVMEDVFEDGVEPNGADADGKEWTEDSLREQFGCVA
jgi:hypothetical protein